MKPESEGTWTGITQRGPFKEAAGGKDRYSRGIRQYWGLENSGTGAPDTEQEHDKPTSLPRNLCGKCWRLPFFSVDWRGFCCEGEGGIPAYSC